MTFHSQPFTNDLSQSTFHKRPFVANRSQMTFHSQPFTNNLSQSTFHKWPFTVNLSQIIFLSQPFTNDLSQSTFYKWSFATNLSQMTFHSQPFTVALLQSILHSFDLSQLTCHILKGRKIISCILAFAICDWTVLLFCKFLILSNFIHLDFRLCWSWEIFYVCFALQPTTASSGIGKVESQQVEFSTLPNGRFFNLILRIFLIIYIVR